MICDKMLVKMDEKYRIGLVFGLFEGCYVKGFEKINRKEFELFFLLVLDW